MDTQKWKKAVVHLENVGSSKSSDEMHAEMRERMQELKAGTITIEEYSNTVQKGRRDKRSWGTAIFLTYRDKRFLMTAKHVIVDDQEIKRAEQRIKDGDFSDDARQELARAKDSIVNMIFRVPSLDEVEKYGNALPRVLMNLGVTLNHVVTDDDIDLAIIGLDPYESKFANELIERGFVPITIEDITEGPEIEGEDVFTVGFPGATSFLGSQYRDAAETNWASDDYSLPVFAFGKVAMLSEHLDYFWTDLSIYAGNSGGPVVSNNKLIGIVSANASISIEEEENLSVRIPFGKIIKAKLLLDLLNPQA